MITTIGQIEPLPSPPVPNLMPITEYGIFAGLALLLIREFWTHISRSNSQDQQLLEKLIADLVQRNSELDIRLDKIIELLRGTNDA